MESNTSDGDSERLEEKQCLELYCFCRGTQQSHISMDCKVMTVDNDRFTQTMHHATKSTSPTRGRTKKYVLSGYKYTHSKRCVTIPPAQHNPTSLPWSETEILDSDQFLDHNHGNIISTSNMECNEILDYRVPWTTAVPDTPRPARIQPVPPLIRITVTNKGGPQHRN